ncbi:hypothetical protein A359_02400 [secondary endosymbiont of Ctenarytaina eucalypti]|uniref:Uncharacterized protein n=1 Tax=secondary endosymbiont of Ctenarytaina eucalypti TaxID=1199245 RepID=J3VRP2_9ENTR|nr:hypothetical protein A359_02400 [secondary endosymbiont of Ctenarytaina eucalypti]
MELLSDHFLHLVYPSFQAPGEVKDYQGLEIF